jgi:phosphatidylethanolamine-binding protein (PEBP) family uncharacterized protein
LLLSSQASKPSKPLRSKPSIFTFAKTQSTPEFFYDIMVQGQNGFGKIGYGGPTPPDQPYSYEVTEYALNAKVKLS